MLSERQILLLPQEATAHHGRDRRLRPNVSGGMRSAGDGPNLPHCMDGRYRLSSVGGTGNRQHDLASTLRCL